MGRHHRALLRRRRRCRRLRRHIQEDALPSLQACSSSDESEYSSESESDSESEQEFEEEQYVCKPVFSCEVVQIKAKCKSKCGGKRNIKTYLQKSECVDDGVVREFLGHCRCTCKKRCLHKLAGLGEQGIQICKTLRAERFECGCIYRVLSST